MTTPRFVERVARLPEVLSVLSAYPDGLPLADLAEQFGVAADVLREDLVMFMDAESWGWVHDIFRPPVLEFADDDRVRVVHDAPTATMGVEHLSAGELALIYTAGLALLDAGGDDRHLGEALAVISETMYGEPAAQRQPAEWNRLLPLLQQAQAERQRVDIVYSRAWRVGVTERTVEPLRLQQTRRGWEVDAGPLDAEGRLRTFLLSNIRSAELSGEPFEPPSDLEGRLARQRRTTGVRVALAQAARWAADMYAERLVVVSEDEDVFVADLELLPPVGERVALLLLAGGPDARVLEPTALLAEANRTLLDLLAHHEEQPEPGDS